MAKLMLVYFVSYTAHDVDDRVAYELGALHGCVMDGGGRLLLVSFACVAICWWAKVCIS